MITRNVTGVQGTQQLAACVARHLRDGDIVLLRGSIGAGKTTWMQAMAAACDVDEPVRSPTFTIAHRYKSGTFGTLAHLDCYRSSIGERTVTAGEWADIEAYFDSGVSCIEWPEPILPWLPSRPTWQIQLTSLRSDDTRLVGVQCSEREREHELVKEVLLTC